jgi:two-component system, NarL family, sensor histidine kinase DesK
VTAVWRWWSGRSNPGRYDLWTRASLYAMFAAAPLLALSLARGQEHARIPGLVVFLILSVAQPAACVGLLHVSLSHYLARGPRPARQLVASASALTAAGVLAGAAAFPAFSRLPAHGIAVSSLVAMLFAGALTTALTPLLSLPALLALVLVSAAAASGWSASTSGTGSTGQALVGGFSYCLYIGFFVLVCRASAWTLRIMWELDGSRTAHARLSVAEERLRFARDLHDVLGRNLSLIAVKSELAGQLARRGDEEAAEHMLEVRRVAHESLREMRAVISGYRTTDLDTELAGARAVLRSAGVSCRIIGDAAGLPPDVQAAVGWVVREGTTNVIRHSDATVCTIELTVLDAPGTARQVTLRMDNDRVRALDAAPGGTGLLGLGERLAGLGGSITTRRARGGHFQLEARLPASGTASGTAPGPASGAAAVPPDPGQPGTGVAAAEPAP